MRGVTSLIVQTHQILRLPRKMTLMINPRHTWNAIYNARSNKCHCPNSPNTAPATKNESHDWSLSHMKRYLQCAEQQVCHCPNSPNTAPATKNESYDWSLSHMKHYLQCAERQVSLSKLTKYCACHEKRISWLILVTHETLFTMRGATSVIVQTHQILRLPRKMTLRHFKEISRKQLKRHFQCGADPRMIREWSEQHPRMIRATSEQETVRRNPPRNRGDFSRLATLRLSFQISPNTAPATKSDTSTSPNTAPATQNDSHDQSAAHMKRYLQCAEQQVSLSNQILRLPRKTNLMIDPCHTWNAIYNARSNKCHCPNSPNTAPATKNESHDWSLSHMKHYLQCAERQVSLSKLTKYCACHEKRISWLILVTHETLFTMRGATSVIVQTHQILRLPRIMTLQHFKEISRKQLKRHFQCGADPRMIREWSEQHPRMIRATSEQETVRRNPPRNRGDFSRLATLRLSFQISPNTAPATKSDTSTSPNTAPATQNDSHDQSAAHMKRYLQCAEQQVSLSNQILRLPRKTNLMIDPCHTWNAIYNARSNKCHCPNSPNTAPATKNESHDWSLSHMKHYLQCAERQVSLSKLTKYCACHEKRISWLILVTHETLFTMRGATSVIVQTHQILRLPRIMTLQHFKEISRKQLKRHFQCGADPRMIREWSEQHPRMIRATSEQETVRRNPPRNRGDFSRSPRAWTKKYNISRSGYHSKFHRILRLPRKVTLQLHQILRLPRKMTLMINPRHTWNAIYNARSNKCHCPNSPNTAPATKNESHDWSLSHMKRYLQCAEQQVSLSKLTKYCACHAKWLSKF